MHREHHRWWSLSLRRDMDLLIIGHAGARVLVFPTSQGKFYEWEDRGMANTLSHQINNGWLQLYCLDSVDAESWYCSWAHPSGRAYRQTEYYNYIMNEVLPLSRQKNDNPYLMTAGTSLGGYHAMTFGLRHPFEVNRIISLSGMFDISMFTGGYSDDNVYFNNPVQFLPNEHDYWRIKAMQNQDIIMAVGRDDRFIQANRDFSSLLWSKGIGNALREWDGWAHDWPYWHQMITTYINGSD